MPELGSTNMDREGEYTDGDELLDEMLLDLVNVIPGLQHEPLLQPRMQLFYAVSKRALIPHCSFQNWAGVLHHNS